ncbi:hypothetical protein [Nocardioides pakistanensis]
MSNRRKIRNPHLSLAAGDPAPPFEPRYNGYKCDTCHGAWLTVDLDDGVTPMFSPCFRTEGCDGQAVSMGYPPGPPPAGLVLLIEWFKPTTTRGLDPVLADHVRRGGLLRRAAAGAPAWVKAMAQS